MRGVSKRAPKINVLLIFMTNILNSFCHAITWEATICSKLSDDSKRIFGIQMTPLFCLVTLVVGLPQPPRDTYPFEVSFGELGTGFGLVDEQFPNVVEFHGIPYAHPPVGQRRFAVSELMENFPKETMNFQKKPAICIQSRFDGDFFIPWQPGASEDCLFLSIWAPKDAFEDLTKKYPVQVFFHGGAYMMGTGNFPDTDGVVVAERQKVVVVHVAYRLGVLGFAHSAEFLSDSGSSGNFGVLDQRVALQWINNYIHLVGGDKDAVTLSGCSAGGQSAQLHLTSPDSWAYFNKIISFSGPIGLPYQTVEEANSNMSWFLKRAGCCLDDEETCVQAEVACLRSLSVSEIQQAASDLRHRLTPLQDGKFTPIAEPWPPVIDGEILTDFPLRLLQRGEIRPNTPIVYGVNEQEGFVFAPDFAVGPPQRYRKVMEQLYGESSDQILSAYPPPCEQNEPICDSSSQFAAWMTDYSWTCSFQAAMSPAIRPTNPIYGFLWNSPIPQTFNRTAMGIFRKCINEEIPCHCWETINYFGNAIRRGLELTQAEQNYIEKSQNYLANFIRTGNPNDFTGNPNGSMDFDEMVNMRDSDGKMNIVGINGQTTDHYR
jgi:para-nitrobenzyl esterase